MLQKWVTFTGFSAARGPRFPDLNWREVIFSYIFFLITHFIISPYLLYKIILPLNLEESTFTILSDITSETVLNGLRLLSLTTIPHYLPDIPPSTLSWIYNLLENFELDTNHTRLQDTLNFHDLSELYIVLDFLRDTLLESYYQPYFYGKLCHFTTVLIGKSKTRPSPYA